MGDILERIYPGKMRPMKRSCAIINSAGHYPIYFHRQKSIFSDLKILKIAGGRAGRKAGRQAGIKKSKGRIKKSKGGVKKSNFVGTGQT